MIKNMLKFGLTIAACSFLLSPRDAAADSSGFPNWQKCDDYMYHAYQECVLISHLYPKSGVTVAKCEESWEVTCEYCDTNY